MAMGNSGGRSSGNRTGQGAARRATERERALVDAPGMSPTPPEPEPRLKLTPRGHAALDWLAWSVWSVACTVLAVLFCKWWGLL